MDSGKTNEYHAMNSPKAKSANPIPTASAPFCFPSKNETKVSMAPQTSKIKENDLIILNEGSHGFKVEKKCEMIEIKQGPFNKLQDKIRFNKIGENKIKIKK